jgi:hypothetical protein
MKAVSAILILFFVAAALGLRLIVNPLGLPVGPLCKAYSQNGTCLQTQNPSSQFCFSYDVLTGQCTACISGYVLTGSTCSPASGSSSSSSTSTTGMVASASASSSGSNLGGPVTISFRDPNCAKYNGTICSACSNSYYFGPSNSCVPVDPLCKTYSQNGACLSCYPGYSINGQRCIVSGQQDPFCNSFSSGGICTGCSSGYYLSSSNGVCTQLNPLCKTSDLSNGACIDCYPGYSISGNTCIVAAAVNIPYCAQINGNACVACISGYYVSAGICALVNVLCATYDQSNGNCLSCIPGFVFQSGQCIMPSLGIDVNCAQYTNSYCTQCLGGYALINYVCGPIDPFCVQYDAPSNTCRSCNAGRTPMGPSCI